MFRFLWFWNNSKSKLIFNIRIWTHFFGTISVQEVTVSTIYNLNSKEARWSALLRLRSLFTKRSQCAHWAFNLWSPFVQRSLIGHFVFIWNSKGIGSVFASQNKRETNACAKIEDNLSSHQKHNFIQNSIHRILSTPS